MSWNIIKIGFIFLSYFINLRRALKYVREILFYKGEIFTEVGLYFAEVKGGN
jgi:hypothetical protein